MDKRTFIGMVEAGEPLIQQAIDAMREYHQAQDNSAPPVEVERLRLLAESLFQAVSDYQLRAVAAARGAELPPPHKAAGRRRIDSLKLKVRALLASTGGGSGVRSNWWRPTSAQGKAV